MKSLASAGLAAALCILPQGGSADGPAAAAPAAPAYTADGRMTPPADYREWIFLTSSLDMDYRTLNLSAMHHMFDNVFVQPEAYHAFLQTGTWPDHTVIVKELRGAGGKSSINKHGHFQTTDTMGLELHVKDNARFPGQWAFFVTSGAEAAQQIPAQAACYSCHREHGAVDNTFVQFYPTLLGIAQQKGTLSPGYLKEQ